MHRSPTSVFALGLTLVLATAALAGPSTLDEARRRLAEGNAEAAVAASSPRSPARPTRAGPRSSTRSAKPIPPPPDRPRPLDAPKRPRPIATTCKSCSGRNPRSPSANPNRGRPLRPRRRPSPQNPNPGSRRSRRPPVRSRDQRPTRRSTRLSRRSIRLNPSARSPSRLPCPRPRTFRRRLKRPPSRRPSPARNATAAHPTPDRNRPGSGPPRERRSPRLQDRRPQAPLKAADAAFVAGRYDEAGRLYGAMAANRSLPASRKDHWAYCRAVNVVSAINARPSSPRDWAAIDAEVRAIQELSPSNWIGEYLRKLAAERGRTPKGNLSRSNKVVVRGANPDEPEGSPQPQPPPEPKPATGPQTQVAWARQSIETANFVVVYVEKDLALAERVARAAEAAPRGPGEALGIVADGPGVGPKCEVVLFPTAKEFSRETLQPPDSPGFSTMGMNSGRIVLRTRPPPVRPSEHGQGGPAARDHPRRPRRPVPAPADPPMGRRGDGRPRRASLRANPSRGGPRRAPQEKPGVPNK